MYLYTKHAHGLCTVGRRVGLGYNDEIMTPGSRPARRVLTDHDRVSGAGRVLHGIAPPS
jgi:hypothetical protein